MFKKFLKKANKEQMVKVTYKHDNDTTTTETMTRSMLAGMVVNDSYIEVIEVVEL